MKKTVFIAFALILAGSAFAFAQETERNADKWSAFSYYNVPILKIFDAREGYVVVYQKNNIGTGTTVIPKGWAKGNEENPKKLKFRNVTGEVGGFMTVVKKDGKFFRVILSLPVNRTHPIWGVLKYNSTNLEGADKETLDDLVLY